MSDGLLILAAFLGAFCGVIVGLQIEFHLKLYWGVRRLRKLFKETG